MQANFFIFSILNFNARMRGFLNKLKQTTFTFITLLNISNLPQFNFKRFRTHSFLIKVVDTV